MKTNYFLSPIPLQRLLTLLRELCVISNHRFILDMPTFYNGLHKGSIQQFMADCRPCYLPSKQFYATNELTYKSFLTVVRHVCKIHRLSYTSQIQYSHSLYQVVYYINVPTDLADSAETDTSTPCRSPPPA